MPSVKYKNLRLVIYPNDHNPPHVHVVSDDFEFRVSIQGVRPHIIGDTFGASPKDIRMGVWAVQQNIDALRALWKEIHGNH